MVRRVEEKESEVPIILGMFPILRILDALFKKIKRVGIYSLDDYTLHA